MMTNYSASSPPVVRAECKSPRVSKGVILNLSVTPGFIKSKQMVARTARRIQWQRPGNPGLAVTPFDEYQVTNTFGGF